MLTTTTAFAPFKVGPERAVTVTQALVPHVYIAPVFRGFSKYSFLRC